VTLRLAVLAAFPYPLPQGSQVYVGEQARALARGGAEVTLLCYGHGARDDDGALAALRRDGVSLVRAPAVLSRSPLGAGPSLRKPMADAALLATLLAAGWRRPFDAILAHNVEAACIALAARSWTRTPVVYVAHTLFGTELSSYAPVRLGSAASALGRAFDHGVARRADALIALSTAAAEALGAYAAGKVVAIAPALEPEPCPAAEAVENACARAGLSNGRFCVYSGNLDAYQDLTLLAEAARHLASAEVVVVTHDPVRRPPAGLRLVRARDAAEARALVFGAALAVLPRRRVGGFPIKLLNYLEASRAIVAFDGATDGLSHATNEPRQLRRLPKSKH